MTTFATRSEVLAAIADGTVTLIDALPASYYDRQHLPGAINLVEAEVQDRADELLPDKHARIVTYCSNAACPNSKAVAARLAKLGYTSVRVYRDGIQDWVEAGLATEGSVVVP